MAILKFLDSVLILIGSPFGLKVTVGASYFDPITKQDGQNLYRYSLKNTY
jgi:hypothetical protein